MRLLIDNLRHFIGGVKEELPRVWCFLAHTPYHVDMGIYWWCRRCHPEVTE
ncbi:MAG TPA: hypothetical protein VD948_08875 [Rhodothermales bacterium]|nr:hypothetical protein [Rhodothermales bacterium]